MAVIEVGKPFPGNFGSGGAITFMTVSPQDDTGTDLMFVVSLENIQPEEISALIDKPMKFGIARGGAIVWFLLLADGPTVFDAPFGIGLYAGDEPLRLLAAARQCRDWPENTRRVLDVVLVAAETNVVVRARRTTMTRAWWIALVDLLEECPISLTRQAYKVAMQEGFRRWEQPIDMIRDCVILEENSL